MPVRYYITKSGDEPTVRSVAVALGQPERDERGDPAVTAAPDSINTGRESDVHTGGVTGLVKDAIKIKKRTPRV